MADFPKQHSGMAPDGPSPHSSPGPADGSDLGGGTDPRREALIASLRKRFALAQARGDAEAKQALFKEAVYLNLPPDLWQEPST
jgi:hypothetical protein